MNSKKLWIFLLLFSLCACSSQVTLKKQTFTIELGQDVYANPRVYLEGGNNIDFDDYKVEAVSVGITKEGNRFTNGNKDYLVPGMYDFQIGDAHNRTTPFKIKIKDTQPPTIGKSSDTMVVSDFNSIDWQDFFEASDLSGVYYEVQEDDFSYGDTITVRIYDRFGNSVEEKVTLSARSDTSDETDEC